MSYDGIQFSNRVDNFSDRDLANKVVDNVLISPTMATRVFGMGTSFSGKTKDITITVSKDSQFQWLGGGAEELNSSVVNNTITLSYGRTMGVQPKAQLDFEDFANDGDAGVIDLDSFKYNEAAATVTNELGTVIYGAGVGDKPNGLDSFCDNGTLRTSIGGQSKTTYPVLKGTYTDSDGILTAAKISAMDDAISASGSKDGSPTIRPTTKTVWSLMEELLTPFLSNQFQANQMPKLPLRGLEVMAPGEFGTKAGFTTMFYRNVPIIKDDSATDGSLYDLNERTFGWAGNTRVPPRLKDRYEKVSFKSGGYKTTTGSMDMPSTAGWFYRKDESLITQLGTVAYFAIVGNVWVGEARRNAQLFDIVGLE
ncbi:hypothetical protein LCGC14_0995790 [marine sediment metagenome]|uniref:Uncharacterized protein n=1 Tax=marine sediment metagenome TaxID=412755 RepID=A0A0F9NQW6_9ZZZZ